MKRFHEGNALSELLVSMSLFLFLLYLVFHLIISIQKQGRGLQAAQNSLNNFFATIDLLKRDIQSAEPYNSHWAIKQSPIWMAHNIHIQWYTKKGSLIRRTGIYDQHKDAWNNYSDSLVLQSVDCFSLLPVKNMQDSILSVSCTLHIGQHSISETIYVKNGVYG